MLANYNSPGLFERCISFIDTVFPGCKELAYKGMNYNASWAKASTPFITEQNNEIVAHLGLIPLDLIVEGEKRRVAAFHGICVKPECRGKGIFKSLMSEALEYSKQEFDSILLFTDIPDLYKPFNFRVLPESNFVIKLSHKGANNGALKKLSMDSSEDLALINDILESRKPVSRKFDVRNDVLFKLNTLDSSLYYAKDLEAIMIYSLDKETLVFENILSAKEHSLQDILNVIPENFSEVILQFCPDMYPDYEFEAVPAQHEGFAMVSEGFDFNEKAFRYPNQYHC
jgi:predicted GNAT family N-acyltransferase|tara:strand:- start:141 stop:995 length:855 start_codon:yes stop_codon:yes gene_type:complete